MKISRPFSPFPRLILLLTCFLTLQSAHGGSATWLANPIDGNWSNPKNWAPNTVPDAPTDTATFGTSNITNISVGGDVEVNSVVFSPGASTYTVTSTPSGGTSSLTLSGSGIINNSQVEHLMAATDSSGGHGAINFSNAALAGSDTVTFLSQAAPVAGQSGGAIIFLDDASAGSASFTTEGAVISGGGAGAISFLGHSNSYYASVINKGSNMSGGAGGTTLFDNSAQSYNTSLTANGGTNGGQGGRIAYTTGTQGVFCQLHIFGNGVLDLSAHLPGFGIGSIDGDGIVLLGGVLSDGNGSHDQTFKGIIQDGANGHHGQLEIVNTTLTLTGANTYTGGTSILFGGLLLRTPDAFGTGTGPVVVQEGTLGGNGNIAGTVTVGDGTQNPAYLAPGIKGTGTLIIHHPLLFRSNSFYNWDVDTISDKADRVIARGVTIESGAQFAASGRGTQALTTGEVFTAIKNRSLLPISGTFDNLPDGATITTNSTNFQVNYEGGDGNDLTLTVMP